MADKSTQLVLEALSRAVTDPAGVPLHGTKTAPGLFAGSGPSRKAAQRCKEDGYLRLVRTEARGKAVQEICALTEKGLAYLLSQVSPKQVLEDLVRGLEARKAQLGELVGAARQAQNGLDSLKTVAEKVLAKVQGTGSPAADANALHDEWERNGALSWTAALLAHLEQWQTSGATEDCPLPELYCKVRQAAPTLTIGRFHDGLRHLYERGQIYLHPWTGPLSELPEPPYALLVGHEIAYYASLRK